jgi:hypothetical protein
MATQHEIRAQMEAYRENSDRVNHPGFDVDKWVEMQCAHADAPKEKWYKRLI